MGSFLMVWWVLQVQSAAQGIVARGETLKGLDIASKGGMELIECERSIVSNA